MPTISETNIEWLTPVQEKHFNTVWTDIVQMKADHMRTLNLKDKFSYETFVSCIKFAIYWGLDVKDGFVLTFNNNYSKFKKENNVTKKQFQSCSSSRETKSTTANGAKDVQGKD